MENKTSLEKQGKKLAEKVGILTEFKNEVQYLNEYTNQAKHKRTFVDKKYPLSKSNVIKALITKDEQRSPGKLDGSESKPAKMPI